MNKEQPYIFKRQIIALFIAAVISTVFFMTGKYPELFLGALVYTIIIAGAFLVPLLRSKVKYSLWLHLFLYELPCLWVIVLIPRSRYPTGGLLWKVVLFNIVYIGILFLISKKEFLHNISGLSCLLPINSGEFVYELGVVTLSTVIEEVCFRGFYIGYFQSKYGIVTIFISALLFVVAHYLSRWADKNFTPKIYLMQFLLGIGLGISYYITGNLLLVIFFHYIFNSSKVINICKRFSRRNYVAPSLFDDYEE